VSSDENKGRATLSIPWEANTHRVSCQNQAAEDVEPLLRMTEHGQGPAHACLEGSRLLAPRTAASRPASS